MKGVNKNHNQWAIARGLALFWGSFALLNLLGELWAAHFDANHWWIDLHPLPPHWGKAILTAVAVLFVTYALRPEMSAWRRRLTVGAGMLSCLGTLANAVQYYAIRQSGQLHAALPVPLSLVVAPTFAFIGWRAWRARHGHLNHGHWCSLLVTFVMCLVAFPLAQMAFFGATDYRRPADAAVVFGARAYASGYPSQALADRVRTACRLYSQGYARQLIFSGGPGDGEVHETEAMRRMAVRLGVPDRAILVDENGLNTQTTVRNTVPMFEDNSIHRVLAVSHSFHLPRIKMTYQRAGRDVFTVPAQTADVLNSMPWLVAREVLALWAYYWEPLLRFRPRS